MKCSRFSLCLFAWLGLVCAVKAALVLPSGISGRPRNPYADGYWHPGIPTNSTYKTASIPAISSQVQFCDPTVVIPGTNGTVPTDGVSDAWPGIQYAMSVCPSNEYVKLPPGHYPMSHDLVINSYTRLVGSGSGVGGTNDPTATKLFSKQTAGPGTNIAPEIITFGIGGNKPIGLTTNQLTYGTNEIDVTLAYWETVRAAGIASPPLLMIVAQTNDLTQMNMQGYADEGGLNSGSNAVAQVCTITNIITNGSCVRIFSMQPFHFTMGLTNKPIVMPLAHQVISAGIDHMELAFGSSNPALSLGPCIFFNSLWCWADDVHVYETPSDGFTFEYCAQCEVAHCWVEGARYNSSGRGYEYHILGPSSDCFVYDNIAQNARHSFITETGGSGNVFAYNYAIGDCNSQETSTSLTWDYLNHAAGTHHTLYEGNYGHMGAADFIHGTALLLTYFRNLFMTGSQNPPDPNGDTNYPAGFTPEFNKVAMYVSPTNWSFAAADNIFATPYFSMYANAAYTNPPSGVGYTYILEVGVDNNAQVQAQTDPQVYNTLYLDGNLDYANGPTGEIRWAASPHSFDQSAIAQFSTSTPGWWSNTAVAPYPPYGSVVVTGYLPAQMRWYLLSAGITIPGGGGGGGGTTTNVHYLWGK